MKLPIFSLALAAMAPAAARADEVIQLLDGTKISGRLVHYYDGVFTFAAGGQEMKLPREKIRSLAFDLPAPRQELGTPEKTFERWKAAVAKGDLPTVLDCYALMVQGLIAQQMQGGPGDDEFAKMRDDVKNTTFKVQKATVKGDTATLKVVRQKGDDIQTAELRFVRENGEWKMTPQ